PSHWPSRSCSAGADDLAAHEAELAVAAVEEAAVARDAVGAEPADEIVVAGLALQDVVAVVAEELVVAVAADERVGAREARDDVVAGPALDRVVAGRHAAGRLELVVAGAEADDVVARVLDGGVVAAEQRHDVA